MFQLEKMFGKSKDSKEFIAELCRGILATTCFQNHLVTSFDSEIHLFYPVCILHHRIASGQAGTPHPQAWCTCANVQLCFGFLSADWGRHRTTRRPSCIRFSRKSLKILPRVTTLQLLCFGLHSEQFWRYNKNVADHQLELTKVDNYGFTWASVTLRPASLAG
jgi:hypothetical protein